MSIEAKIAKAFLIGLAVILFCVGYGVLIYVDWKIALGVFLAIWSEGVIRNLREIK